MTTKTQETKSELELLKEQADSLGIEYKVNASVKTLKKLISDFYKEDEVVDENELRLNTEAEALKLVRVIVSPLDPSKRDYQGDIFSAGNAYIPTVTKFIPFNVEWFVPSIIVNAIKEKQMIKFTATRDGRGREVREHNLVRAYSVQELPPLTQEELQQLAESQTARQAIE